MNSKNLSNKNFLKKIIDGDHSLCFSYWIYYTFPATVISIVSIISEPYIDNMSGGSVWIFVIFIYTGLAYVVLSMVGVWNSANKYRIQKKKLKKSAGWATAAQIVIVLAGIRMIVEIVKSFTS